MEISKKTPFEVLKEANKRKKSAIVETPFDFLRMLNKERVTKILTEKILRRVTT